MGPRLKPCGTPEVAEYSFDSNPPYCTNCLLFSKYDSIKASKFEEKALCSNFVSKKSDHLDGMPFEYRYK